MKRPLWIPLFVILIIFTLILLLRVELPYTIRGKGIVKPAKEWGLYTAADGTLVNVLEDHVSGSLNKYKVLEFQRGDIVSFHFNEKLFQKNSIEKGDTIAWVISNELLMRMVEKRGALTYQQALLEVALTGDKPEAVRLALDEVELAEQELETQEKLTARIRHLYHQELVSQQEYELAVNDLLVKKYELEIARSNYQAILAGKKEEEIGVVRSRIASLEQQLIQLERHIDEMNILSPIAGIVIRQREVSENGSNEVIRIADLSSMLLFVPIDLFEKRYVRPGQTVSIHNRDFHREITGEVVGMDNSVQIINRRPKLFVSVMVHEGVEHDLLSNMIVDVRIVADEIPLYEYLVRKSRVVYQN